MKTFTIEDIRNWKPCYDPSTHLPENWEGTVLDILKHKEIPPSDKLWVVCREELISEKTMRLFAVWCAKQVQHLMTDERSIAALDVAERYARGKATEEELAAAWAAAAAARSAARDAARSAADAARVAARDAARSAAWAAAAAARSAARDAARSAAAAARSAARDAADAARSAARDADAARDAADAARSAQITRLIEMIEEGRISKTVKESALPKWIKLTPENAPSDEMEYLVKDNDGDRFSDFSETTRESTYKEWSSWGIVHFAPIVWPVDEEGES